MKYSYVDNSGVGYAEKNYHFIRDLSDSKGLFPVFLPTFSNAVVWVLTIIPLLSYSSILLLSI